MPRRLASSPARGDAHVLERPGALELLGPVENRHLAVDPLPVRRGAHPRIRTLVGSRGRSRTCADAVGATHEALPWTESTLPLSLHGVVSESSKRFAKRFETTMRDARVKCRRPITAPGSQPRTAATMAQIAERAGVALSTVSYVLSGKRSVSPKMRERVLAAIEELDYRPHRPARALASGASHTIALFLPSPQWQLLPIQQTFVAGATQATSASDYALLLSTAATDPETIAQLVARGRADGVILMETLLARPPDRAPPGRRPPVHAHRPHARHDRDQLRRHGLRRRGRDESRAPRPARPHLRRALQLPARPARRGLHVGADRPRRLRAGAPPTSASAASRSPAHTRPREAFAVAARLLRSEPAVHGRDHDRLAVHRTARARCARPTFTSRTTSPSSR